MRKNVEYLCKNDIFSGQNAKPLNFSESRQVCLYFKIENININKKRAIGRKKAENFELEDETFGEVLTRLEGEGDEYVEWDEIMEFFTRRGRPKLQD